MHSNVPSNALHFVACSVWAAFNFLLPGSVTAGLDEIQLFGHVRGEYRHFTETGAAAARYRHNASFAVEPEIFLPIAGSDDSFRFNAFYRWDQHDNERTRGDIRELRWHRVEQSWELSVGIDVVFWGVTETVHLVNIINQQDFVENIDGEDLLGQPMIQLDVVRDWGTLGVFILPYFRERTFPGVNGRPGSGLAIDTETPVYESGAKQRHTDFALRWSRSVGNWDMGAAFFRGTSREPRLEPVFADNAPEQMVKLKPIYEIINQVGVDVQGTFDAWLWKLEAIHRSGQTDSFIASAAGFEYTMFDILRSSIDIGLVAEFLYDERGAVVGTDNDVSLGIRLTWNDINSTNVLAAIVHDLDNRSRFFFVEASRRIGNAFTLSLEARGAENVVGEDSLNLFNGDSYLQLELAYYF